MCQCRFEQATFAVVRDPLAQAGQSQTGCEELPDKSVRKAIGRPATAFSLAAVDDVVADHSPGPTGTRSRLRKRILDGTGRQNSHWLVRHACADASRNHVGRLRSDRWSITFVLVGFHGAESLSSRIN
jgi:hypothetical protein